jgi:Helitron helicase-like domain at N-terminus
VPIGQYPGLPRNAIEHHEMERARRIHHQQQLQPLATIVSPPLMPPFQQAPRRDYGAELMERFTQDHEQRRTNRGHRNRQMRTIPQQHVLNFQANTQAAVENTNQNIGHAQAGTNHQEILNNILAEQEYRQHVQQTLHAQQENTQQLAADTVMIAEQRREELELQRRAQTLAQERAIQERRIREKEDEINDFYNDYGPQLAGQFLEDQDRNRIPEQDDDIDFEPSRSRSRSPPHRLAFAHAPAPSPSPPPSPPPIALRSHSPSPERRIPPGAREYAEPIDPNHLGSMDIECSHCHALHFDSEKLSKSTRRRPVFGMCCLEGLVHLPPFLPWPNSLRHLYEDDANFRNQIRQYNSALAFTSLGVDVDRSVTQGSGPSSFRIHGSLHHLMGTLEIPENPDDSKYAQLYIFDPQEATDIRLRRNINLDRHTLAELHDTLANHHPYIDLFKQAYQILREKAANEDSDLRVRLELAPGNDARRYNLQAVDEIAAIIPGDGTEVINENRDIILRYRGQGLRRISHLHRAYSTLHYVLLFPKGEDGWHLNIPLQVIPGRNSRSKHVTQLLFYAYRLHLRPLHIEPNNIFLGGRLFQQYVCDAWASIEQSNLSWIYHNQKKIRSELYNGLQDHAAQDPNLELGNVGRSIILPSSHTGSPRYMQQLLQDSLAICRDCRKPDLFLTMTANPTWPEITENLLPSE